MRTIFLALMISCIIVSGLAHAEENCEDGLASYIAENYEKALSIFEPLAEKGDACAQYQLGEMYNIGQGVKQDKQKAIELFKKAAVQGDKKAKIKVNLLEKQ